MTDATLLSNRCRRSLLALGFVVGLGAGAPLPARGQGAEAEPEWLPDPAAAGATTERAAAREIEAERRAAAGAVRGDRRGYLGVTLGGKKQVRVFAVVDGSPAARAGIEEGDVVLAIDGKAVVTVAEASDAIQAHKPDEEVRIRLTRDGQPLELTARLDARPGTFSTWVPNLHLGEGKWGEGFWSGPDVSRRFMRSSRAQLGLQLQRLTPGLRAYFHAPEDGGVLVADVREGSPAAKAGIKAGDVLLAVGGTVVRNPGDVVSALVGAEPGSRVAVELLREGVKQTIEVTLEERGASKDGVEGRPADGGEGLDGLSPEIQRAVREAMAEARKGLEEACADIKKSLRDSKEDLRINVEELRKALAEMKVRLRSI